MSDYRYPDAVIMIFCKAPVPGKVKTRLLPSLSAAEAAEVHRELSRRALKTAAESGLCRVQLWCAPTSRHPFFAELASGRAGVLREQQGADLGARMRHAFDTAFSRYRRAVIIGCDCPSLTAADLDRALAALADSSRCALTPAEDGGYVLIGLNRPAPSLFTDMPWGSDRVLHLTLERLRRLRREVVQMDCRWDVDTADDLRRYRALYPPDRRP